MSSITNKALLAVALAGAFAFPVAAQTADPPDGTASGSADRSITTKKPIPKPHSERMEDLQDRLDQAQAQIQQQQAQIEQLQKSLQNSVDMLLQQQRQLQVSVEEAKEQASAARDSALEAGTVAANVKSSVTSVSDLLRAQGTDLAKAESSVDSVEAALNEQHEVVKSLEEPASIHYKGLRLTPGGFFEATALVRNRNENADMADTFTGIPLNGTSNSKLSEFRGTVRDSRMSLLVEGNAGATKLTGYVEGDFMGAAPTANFIESSSFTPRLRQAWLQIDRPSGWSVAAGQFWSLLTTNRQGLAPRSEFIPNVMDGAYVVGYTWTRERSVRVTRNFHNKIWAAFEMDGPENTYSAAYVPANVMGLNTSQNAATGVQLLPYLAGYSNGNSTTLAPDLLAKVVFEPGWGHFEIKGLGRFFRDRIAATATTPGRMNYTEGYGIGFGAIFPVVKSKLDVEVEGMAGQGIGRYGASGLPDVTLNPTTGAMKSLREARIMGAIEYHLNKHFDFFAYGGDEYVARYAMVAPGGGAAGYGSPLVSYAACTNEVAINTCSGANRNIYEATAGYWFYPFKGRFGRIQYGNQVEYLHRTLWSGLGHTPQGGDLVIFSTVRFYLP